MGDIKIKVRLNFETGLRDIVIEYDSDADSLPIEHEQRHASIVKHLIDVGILKDDEVGEIVIERITEQKKQDKSEAPPNKPSIPENPLNQ